MGLVGMGRAFNLRFMPNGPLRTNCYHRPMPHVGIFGGGGNFSYTENINIQQGPTGFWGFMSGLCQGLFGGGMFGMGGGLFGCGMGGGLFGMLNARQATPQGAGGQKNPDLDNLNAFFGSKGYIIRMEKDGTYTAAKDGKIVASGSYDDVKTKLSDLADTSDDTTTKKDTPDELAKTHKPPLTKGDDGKWKDEAGNVYEWDADNKSFDKQNKAGVTSQGQQSKPQLDGEDNKAKADDLKQNVSITVMDEVWDAAHPGQDGHVTGKTILSGKKNDEGFDKQITVGGKRYALQDEKVDGDPVYKSLDGDGDTYRLSKKDGKLVLIQSESDKDKLSGVGTTDIHPSRQVVTNRRVAHRGGGNGGFSGGGGGGIR